MFENATILAEIQRISLIPSTETTKSGQISIENIPTAILEMLQGLSILAKLYTLKVRYNMSFIGTQEKVSSLVVRE